MQRKGFALNEQEPFRKQQGQGGALCHLLLSQGVSISQKHKQLVNTVKSFADNIHPFGFRQFMPITRNPDIDWCGLLVPYSGRNLFPLKRECMFRVRSGFRVWLK